MKFEWRSALRAGVGVGKMFLPKAVADAIDAVEDNVATMVAGGGRGWSGAEKQEAALNTLVQGVAVAEGLSGRDLLDDAAVAHAGRQAIDTAHAAAVAAARFQATVSAFKAATVQAPAAPDGTGHP